MILSGYCAYLLVSRPCLLPLHPDMARIAYMQLVEQLMSKEYYGENATKRVNCSDKSELGSRENLAHKLQLKGVHERWKLIADYYAELVIYIYRCTIR
ncbi:hypothetical protein SUGI_0341720 [Cryptomeria japonica]|nr:hypothetical protein SUGI_0341720 [Cryptomeria japonica]